MKVYLRIAGLIAALVVTAICWIAAGEKELTTLAAVVFATMGLSTYLLINPSLVFLDFRSQDRTLAKAGPMAVVTIIFFVLSIGTYTFHILSISTKVQVIAILINYGLPVSLWLLITGFINSTVDNSPKELMPSISRNKIMVTLDALKANFAQPHEIDKLIDKLRFSPEDTGSISREPNAEIFNKIESSLVPAVYANDEDKILAVAVEISKMIHLRNSLINSSRNKI